MDKKYIFINGEKLKISNWIKWLMLVGIYFVSLILISIIENIISNITHINIVNVGQVTFYLRGFIIILLIYDLAPRFKASISIMWSVLLSFVYLGIDVRAGDRLYLGTFMFIIVMSAVNIFLYKKNSNLNSKKHKK